MVSPSTAIRASLEAKEQAKQPVADYSATRELRRRVQGAMDGTSSVPELEGLDSARKTPDQPMPGADKPGQKLGLNIQMGSPESRYEEHSKAASGDATPLNEPSTAKLVPSAF